MGTNETANDQSPESLGPAIAESLRVVRARIAAACARAGRATTAIQLVAVSKYLPVDRVRAGFAAGQLDFGENYAQELRDKAEEVAALGELRWHAIGPLQTNKVKYVAEAAYAFHALDRVEVAVELGRRRKGPPVRCFVEVNIADEPSKKGVSPGAVRELYEKVRGVAGIEVVGLMCLPPKAPSIEEARPWFRQLRELSTELGLPELSMGTTEDFEVAIEEGATVVRVGRGIFGERPPRHAAAAAD
jgi:pyridoxal phosphate enzyme (YggS family)